MFIVIAAVLILVMVVTAVIGALGQDRRQPEAAESSAPDAASAAESPTADTDVLLATITRLGDGDESRIFVFDEHSSDDADAILESDLPYYGNTPEFVGDLLSAGAYLSGTMSVFFTLQTDLAQQVTVTGIRAEIIEELEPITGGTFIEPMPGGGDPIDQMHLLLNAPVQGPYLLDENTGNRTDRAFFEEQVINVAPGDKQAVMVKISLDDESAGGAYEYRLVVDYEVDGEFGSVTIDNDGTPFRMTSFSCEQDRFFGQPDSSWGEGDPGYVEMSDAIACQLIEPPSALDNAGGAKRAR
ncbi:hypothetical protein [Glycomyces tritici]|uniref:GerMN domain-containing protein n=1 Tax=Glycomyces tritici TaxID=2665176 RepID=A0ABT7YN13_9ACTN|nr:hypothetical protein [Glycomyces tritici]MDN3240002.1 hypothetical protein [Glycomyces tritici]